MNLWDRLTFRRLGEVVSSRRARRHAKHVADCAHAATDDEVRKALSSLPTHYADATVMQVGTTVSNRGRSGMIWRNMQVMNLIQDPGLGAFVGDDFLGWNGTVATNVGTYSGPAGGYKSYEVTSGSIKQINTMGPAAVTGPAGVIALTTVSGANKNVALELGGGNGGSFEITNAAPPSRVAWECRFQVDQIAGNDLFVGMAEKGLAVVSGAGSFFTTADALSQDTFMGFYRLTGTTAATMIANAGTNGSAPATSPGSVTVATSTWYSAGWIYDATQPGNQFQFYWNNALVGGFASPGATGFPSGKVVTPFFACQNDATGTNANNLYLDWWYGATIFQG